MLAGTGDVDEAVRSGEDAGRDRGRVIIAGLFRHIAVHQPACGLKIQHRDLRLQQRCLDPLALAGLFTPEKRQQHTLRGKTAGRQVGNRNADPHRAFARRTGDRHQPAHALGDLVKARAPRQRAVLAEAGNRGIDKPRVRGAEGLVIDAEAELHIGAVVLDHHIGCLGHFPEDRDTVRILEVQHHRALVAMQILEVGPLARAAHVGSGLVGILDLDDIRPPVRKLADTGGAGAHPCQV